MTRRALLTRLAMMIIALVALVASERASATTLAAPCCDTYTVDIDCSIPPSCLPITITTYWLNGAIHTSPAISGCGPTVVSLLPQLPPCYGIAANFKYLTINGDPTIVVLNKDTTIKIGNCCYGVHAYVDPATGCLRIKIWRC